MITPIARQSHPWRTASTLLLVAIVVAIVWLTRSNFIASLRTLQTASSTGVLVAGVLVFVSILVAATIYQRLALKKLRFWPTVLIEMAASAVNRVLPAGLGGLGLHGVYLYRQKHTAAQATAVVSINNLLGITAHLLLLLLVVIFSPVSFHKLTTYAANWHIGWLPDAVVALLVVLMMFPQVRGKITSFGCNLLTSLKSYARKPSKIVYAFILAMSLTVLYTLILYVSAHALHLNITLVPCFIVFSLGMLVGTATPTPGGLAGAEAGLFAGFVAYGFTAPDALAATLLFRLMTYWMPILPGALALLLARKKKLV